MAQQVPVLWQDANTSTYRIAGSDLGTLTGRLQHAVRFLTLVQVETMSRVHHPVSSETRGNQ